MLHKTLIFCFTVLLLSACKSSYTPEDLKGKWVYKRSEYTNKSLEQPRVIETQKPYIVFHENGKAEIYSSGKILSHGQYHLENSIIRYEEVLPDSSKRKIPFLIKELDEHHLVFETMADPVMRITAEKTGQ